MKASRINEIIENYIKNNQPEIQAYIEKRVDTSIKAAIRSIFQESSYGHDNPKGQKLVNQRINDLVNHTIDDITINQEEIKELLNKKITRTVKKAQINIDL